MSSDLKLLSYFVYTVLIYDSLSYLIIGGCQLISLDGIPWGGLSDVGGPSIPGLVDGNLYTPQGESSTEIKQTTKDFGY